MAEVRYTVLEDKVEDTEGTGVITGVKVIYQLPPIPKMVCGISTVIRITVVEVGWSDQRVQGGVDLGKMGNSGVTVGYSSNTISWDAWILVSLRTN